VDVVYFSFCHLVGLTLWMRLV